MDKIRIRGGKKLKGSVQVSGAKNAALPILFSALLAPGKHRFTRVPRLNDIHTTIKILKNMGIGVDSNLELGQVEIDASQLSTFEAPYDLVRTMRASVVVLGPLLARLGRARVSLPGGCAIGARPINFHLTGLEKLGAQISIEEGYVVAKARRLKGARVALDFPSVGATENLMMAATLAQGTTLLENCAKEPEIVDLAKALRSMGALISGEGTEAIEIQGRDSLNPAHHEIMGDRIEAGTYLAAALATQGSVRVDGIEPRTLSAVLSKFQESGAKLELGPNFISLETSKRAVSTDIITQPFPGFPTDMQAQFMAMLCVAEGTGMVTETVFENRFMHVSELARLGAEITIRGNTAQIRGKEKLLGAPIMATDLRASASLVIAGLCASGETIINRIYHLDRGYENMEKKLLNLGADIERIE